MVHLWANDINTRDDLQKEYYGSTEKRHINHLRLTKTMGNIHNVPNMEFLKDSSNCEGRCVNLRP